MKPENERKLIREAILDPECNIDQELEKRLNHEEQIDFRDGRAMHAHLKSAFQDLRNRTDVPPPGDRAFRERLEMNLATAEKARDRDAARRKDIRFFKKTARQARFDKWREKFLRNPVGVYRLAPVALLALIILPSIPILRHQGYLQEDHAPKHTPSLKKTNEISLASTSPRDGKLEVQPKKADSRPTKKIKAVPFKGRGKGRDKGRSKPIRKGKRDLFRERSLDSLAVEAGKNAEVPESADTEKRKIPLDTKSLESALLKKLKQSKTKREKLLILQRLARLYKQSGRKTGLRRIRKRMKQLQR